MDIFGSDLTMAELRELRRQAKKIRKAAKAAEQELKEAIALQKLIFKLPVRELGSWEAREEERDRLRDAAEEGMWDDDTSKVGVLQALVKVWAEEMWEDEAERAEDRSQREWEEKLVGKIYLLRSMLERGEAEEGDEEALRLALAKAEEYGLPGFCEEEEDLPVGETATFAQLYLETKRLAPLLFWDGEARHDKIMERVDAVPRVVGRGPEVAIIATIQSGYWPDWLEGLPADLEERLAIHCAEVSKLEGFGTGNFGGWFYDGQEGGQ